MADIDEDPRSPFVAYHRARALSVLTRVLGIGVPSALVVTGLIVAGSFGVAHAVPVPSDRLVAITAPTATPTPSPAPAVPQKREVAVTPIVAARPAVTRITITAAGYQKQLDECQWVRMDIGAIAPIVGAHTSCGGSPVLTLRPGQVVQLGGEGLDGRYVVTGGRDAHSGDDAFTATEGLDASVILQTCYPGTGGRVRLIALEPQI